MIRRRGAHELILGMAVDVTFGPFLLFGHGGTAVEVIDDKALVLPPLNLNLARETMSRTRVYRELFGYRAEPPAAIDAIAETLVRLSQLVCDIDEVTEIDINPLLADSEGVVVLDTRVRIAAPPASEARARGGRLAIQPYPKQLERRETLPGVGDVLLRPVQPEDEPAFVRFLEQLTPEDMRLRFFSARKILPHRQLARLTQIDYDREMAFVLEAWDRSRPADILGIVRFAAAPDNLSAEFAVTVRSDLKGHGIGTYLMHRLIEHVRRRSIGELFGDILHENVRMIALTRDLSFSIEEVPNVPDIVRARLAL
jgi:acetyltransferase